MGSFADSSVFLLPIDTIPLIDFLRLGVDVILAFHLMAF